MIAMSMLCTLSSVLSAFGGTEIPLNPKATYLHTATADSSLSASPIDLASLGFNPGDMVRLERLGLFDNGPQAEVSGGLLGVFSSSNVLLAPANAHRVPGAIDAGVDFDSACTFFGCQPTNIPEDFAIGAPDLSFVSVCMEIPAGAAYLFVAPHDSLYEDNSDPNPDYALRITRLICPADITSDGSVNVNDLLSIINAWGPRGGIADIAPLCGDGAVNVNDLLAVINSWGACR